MFHDFFTAACSARYVVALAWLNLFSLGTNNNFQAQTHKQCTHACLLVRFRPHSVRPPNPRRWAQGRLAPCVLSNNQLTLLLTLCSLLLLLLLLAQNWLGDAEQPSTTLNDRR